VLGALGVSGSAGGDMGEAQAGIGKFSGELK
jgi:hypothetical protein